VDAKPTRWISPDLVQSNVTDTDHHQSKARAAGVKHFPAENDKLDGNVTVALVDLGQYDVDCDLTKRQSQALL